MTEGPRIYNLFPGLIGPLDQWMEHVTRAKNMGFNFVYVNPVSFPGFSGSLYAIKDFYKFNPLFAPTDVLDEEKESWEPFRQFIQECHGTDMRVVMDLVINHTSIDCPLIEEHPDWYVHKWAVISRDEDRAVFFFSDIRDPREIGDLKPWPDNVFYIEWRIANPGAIDPADARKVTIWGDLAEIDNEYSPDRDNLWHYWQELVDFYVSLGVDGFRCDAAYQVPVDLWQSLIGRAKHKNPDLFFLAETLGCKYPQIKALNNAGFDFIMSSSKYWDYTQPWAPEQYNSFRELAPSISFPESHDTNRLAADSHGRRDVQIFKYLFAAVFSAGIMLPIGYEFGFQKKLDVVATNPQDWERPTFDITEDISQINSFKRTLRVLNEDGPIVHYPYGDTNILVLRKTTIDERDQFLLLYNKDWTEYHRGYLADMSYFLTLGTPIYRITLDGTRIEISTNLWDTMLAPNECILFLQQLDEE